METNEETLDAELGRWQEAIRGEVIRCSGASDHDIDGGGCDSGDPLDLSLTEISQGFNHIENRCFEFFQNLGATDMIRDDESALDALLRYAGELHEKVRH